MATDPAQTNAFVEALASPMTRAVLAVLTVSGALISYINGVRDRLARSHEVMIEFEVSAKPYKIVNRWPHVFHSIVAHSVFFIAAVQLVLICDSFFLGSVLQQSLPSSISGKLPAFNIFSVAYILFAILMWLTFQLETLEKIASWATGLSPKMRNSLDWANAKWQLRRESERRSLGVSKSNMRRFSSLVIDGLVKEPPNRRLALRPKGLGDVDAANLLYFGHVVEWHCSQVLKQSFPWTDFYYAMAKVQLNNMPAPFSPSTLLAEGGVDRIMKSILEINAYLPSDTGQVPNDAGLEDELKAAHAYLVKNFKGDAINLAKTGQGNDYERVFKSIQPAFKKSSEEMCRQFAKLFIVWNVKPGATRPDQFQMAFSRGILLRYFDEEVLKYNGSSFVFADELVQICYDNVHSMVVEEVKELLDQSSDPVRKSWREKQRELTESRGVDWEWWMLYRADQHIYSMSVDWEPESWLVVAGEKIEKK